jgi:hypothetical protein
MNKRLLLLLCTFLIFTICLTGCDNPFAKDYTFKVMVDKLGETNVMASLYSEGKVIIGSSSETFYWRDKKLVKSKEEYLSTYPNIYPSSSLAHLQEQLQLTEKQQMGMYGSPRLYGNTKDYELFIFENPGDTVWKIIFSYEHDMKEVDIPKDKGQERASISSYQITDDAIYLFAQDEIVSDIYIYKVLLSNFEFTKRIIPLQKFNVKNVSLRTNEVFVHDNVFVLATSNYNRNFNKGENNGILLNYDIANDKANTVYIADKIAKILPYNDGYIAICREKETLKAMIRYYDKNLKLFHKTYISVPEEVGVLMAETSQFYLYNGQLYGTLQKDGRRERFLTVLNAQTAEVQYLAEFFCKRQNFATIDIQYYLIEDGKFFHLRPFPCKERNCSNNAV